MMKHYCRSCKRFFENINYDRGIKHCPHCYHIYNDGDYYKDKRLDQLYYDIKEVQDKMDKEGRPFSIVLYEATSEFIMNALREYYDHPLRNRKVDEMKEYPRETQLQSWKNSLKKAESARKEVNILFEKEIGNCEDNIKRYEMEKEGWIRIQNGEGRYCGICVSADMMGDSNSSLYCSEHGRYTNNVACKDFELDYDDW